MKRKPSKKISLNRETLKQLDNSTLYEAAGGDSTTPSCFCSAVCTNVSLRCTVCCQP